jgi:hypothetical protein
MAIFSLFLGGLAAGLVYQAVTALEVLIGVLVGVAALWVLVTSWRAGIGVGARAVTVRSRYGWTRKVPWQEVAGFRADPVRWSKWNSTRAVAVVCHDQRRLTTGACTFTPSSKNSGYTKLQEMLQVLEKERAAAGSRTFSSDLTV